jgi:uncharacterized LabA/DUF88 family protein
MLTLNEASKITGVNKETLKKACQSGGIKGAVVKGKTWIIPENSLLGYTRKKAGVYIDGANILHGGMKAGWLVDYVKLMDFLKNRFDPSIFSFYDSVGYEKDSVGRFKKNSEGKRIHKKTQVGFYNFLKGLGIRMITKPLKYIDGNPEMPKNNMDSYITLDVIKEADLWDELVLFSGDSDFDRLVEDMIGLRKKTHIFSFESHLSYELKTRGFTSPLVNFTTLDSIRDKLEDLRKKPKRR